MKKIRLFIASVAGAGLFACTGTQVKKTDIANSPPTRSAIPDKSEKIAPPAANEKPPSPDSVVKMRTVEAETGCGKGKNDQGNYKDYKSVIILTPLVPIPLAEIRPVMASCKGNCTFDVSIQEKDGGVLGSASWKGTNAENLRGQLERDLSLDPKSKYIIKLHVTSTEGVDLCTTGSMNGKVGGKATYTTRSARHMERGPLAFKLLH